MFGQQLALLDLLSTFFKALVENVRENFNTLRPKPLTSKTPRLLYLLKTNKKKRLLGYLLLFPYFSSHSSSLSFCVEICCISDRDRAKCKFIAEQTFGNPEELVGLFYSQTIGSKKKNCYQAAVPHIRAVLAPVFLDFLHLAQNKSSLESCFDFSLFCYSAFCSHLHLTLNFWQDHGLLFLHLFFAVDLYEVML